MVFAFEKIELCCDCIVAFKGIQCCAENGEELEQFRFNYFIVIRLDGQRCEEHHHSKGLLDSSQMSREGTCPPDDALPAVCKEEKRNPRSKHISKSDHNNVEGYFAGGCKSCDSG